MPVQISFLAEAESLTVALRPKSDCSARRVLTKFQQPFWPDLLRDGQPIEPTQLSLNVLPVQVEILWHKYSMAFRLESADCAHEPQLVCKKSRKNAGDPILESPPWK